MADAFPNLCFLLDILICVSMRSRRHPESSNPGRHSGIFRVLIKKTSVLKTREFLGILLIVFREYITAGRDRVRFQSIIYRSLV